MSVFGVDFGTLNSTVALTRNGGVDIILNEVSKRETFTFVSLGDEERYLGESGADKAVRNAANTVGSIKRFIGLRADDPAVAKEKRFFFGNTSADAEGRLMFDLKYNGEMKQFYPEQVLAMFLGKLSQYVDREAVVDGAKEGTHVKDCVLTVPCYYTAEQRKLMTQAAEIAGLNCMALINETSAAGIDYGIFRGASLPDTEAEAQTVAIVDLGYGASTVSISKYWKGNMKVLTHAADKNVGTRELDYFLTQHFAAEIQKKYKIDVNENKRARVRMLQACEKVKTLLSGNQTAPLNIENLMDVDVNIVGFTREEMETACSEVFERLSALIKQAVAQAGLEMKDIQRVEVIGGGSRIPKMKKTVEEAFQQAPCYTLNATESVARGCAITAAVYSPKFRVREYVVHESPCREILLGYHSTTATAVSSVSFLPEVNKVIKILNKTDRYPKTLELTFDRKEEFDLHYFYDEEKCEDLKSAKQPLRIGHAKIGTTDKETTGKVKVEIKFHPSGLIDIVGAHATEEYEVEVEKPKEIGDTSEEKEFIMEKRSRKVPLGVTPTCDVIGFNGTQVMACIKTEQDMVARDTSILRTKETKNALESYIYDFRSNLSEGGLYYKFVKKEQADQFVENANKYENWLYDDEYPLEEYQTRLTELKSIGDLAQKRYRLFDDLPFEKDQHVKKINEVMSQAKRMKNAKQELGKFAWIEDAELDEATKICQDAIDAAEKEIADFKAADPAHDTTISTMKWFAALKDVQAKCKPIFEKPEPKPEPEPEAEEGEKKEGDAEAPKTEAAPAPEGPKVDAEMD